MKTLGILALAAALPAAAGCGTFCDMASDQKMFGGTRFVAESVGKDMGGGPCASCGPLWLLDLPFSLAADTILLPVTVTIALVRPAPPPPKPLVR